jgi:hypothetical protein
MSGIERKLGKHRRKKPLASAPTEAEKVYKSALENLSALGGLAMHVSVAQTGMPTDRRGELRSIIFAKMVAHSRSIGAICQSSMFDHSAIISLARMIVEAATMIAYLSADIDEDKCQLQLLVLKLHDTVGRIKFLRAFNTDAGMESLRAGRTGVEKEIKANLVFLGMEPDEQKQLLSGEVFFVGGMRRAAKLFGWNGERFTSLYSYLSSHSHTSPMSYMRTREHKIDYLQPGDAQRGGAAFAIEIAIACIRRVVIHTIDLVPNQKGLYPNSFVDMLRSEDAESAVFGDRASE